MARRGNSPAPSAGKAAHDHDEEETQEFDLTVHLTAHSPLLAVVAVLLALLVWYSSYVTCIWHNKPGHFCSDDTLDFKYQTKECAAGTYCLGRWGAPVQCPAGRFSATVGAVSAADCKECPAGTFSDKVGFSGPCSACQAPAGSYCKEGSAKAEGVPCPAGSTCAGLAALPLKVQAGHYTLANATLAEVKECPAGTGSDKVGLDSEAACVACEAGTYQVAAGQTHCENATKGFFVAAARATAQVPCPAGQFQHDARASSCINCKKGMYNGRTGQAACNVAKGSDASAAFKAGHYVPTEGAKEPTKCAASTQTLVDGQDHCEACPVGQHAEFDAAKAYTGCAACPAGTFGGIGTIPTCEPCPAGSFSSKVGAVNIEICELCPPGTYGVSDGATTSAVCKDCEVAQGFYCPGGDGSNDGKACPEKKFCPGGKEQPVDIKANHYVAATKALLPCPAGTWLPDSTKYEASWRDFKGLYACRPTATPTAAPTVAPTAAPTAAAESS